MVGIGSFGTFETACLADTAGTIAFSLRYSRRRTEACRYLRLTLSAANDFDEATAAADDGSGPAKTAWQRRRPPLPPPHWWKYNRCSSAFSIVRFRTAAKVTVQYVRLLRSCVQEMLVLLGQYKRTDELAKPTFYSPSIRVDKSSKRIELPCKKTVWLNLPLFLLYLNAYRIVHFWQRSYGESCRATSSTLRRAFCRRDDCDE